MYPPTEINRHSLQAYSGVFVPKRDIYLPCTCFEMVDARPSMPDTVDGCECLGQTKMRGLRATRKTRGTVTESPKGWWDTGNKGRELTSEDARWFYLED